MTNPETSSFDLPAHIWWSAQTPDRVFVTINDDRFTDENGEHPGLWVTWETNWRSADYHPHNVNRYARACRAAGLPGPAETELGERRLATRFRRWREQP